MKLKKHQKIAIVMGSQSDYSTMRDCVKILKSLKISFDVKVVSAHRTPKRLYEFAKKSETSYSVIIAGAGGSAHLPGMIAALTPLPVIGVPVKTSTLSGVDSLYSICQMPKGIPVATVAIGNASNAGLLAVRILGANGNNSDYVGKGLLDKMENYMINQEETVLKKADKLENIGYEQYLDGM